MNLMEIIRERRSVRQFKGDPIPDGVIEELMEAVRWAPSWANTQCWEVIAVKGKEQREGLAETLSPRNPGRPAVLEAPLVLVFLGRKEVSGFYKGKAVTEKGDWLMFDVALAIQNLCLYAHSRGLGTVIIGYFDAGKAASLLGVPPDREVVAILPIGYPASIPKAPPRKEVKDFLYWEEFGRR